MIRWLFLFLLVTSPCLASVDPADERLLKTAADLVNIRAANEKPFQLDIDFTAQFDVLRDGHLTLKWVSKDMWSQLITIKDFHLLEIRKGDNRYLLRNSPFTPRPLSKLIDLTSVLSPDFSEWKLKKVKRKTINGKDTACMELRPKTPDETSKRYICIDVTSSEILSDEMSIENGTFSNRTKNSFSNYEAFGGHRYPHQLKLEKDGVTKIDAKVVSLKEMSFPDSTFLPPPGAVARRECEHLTNPLPISTPKPKYPPSAREKNVMGITIVGITILKDGSVTDVQVVQSADPSMDSATVDTVKTWKFKPAMCGTEPIIRDIQVEVTFDIRP
jgi:TonB family protein